MLRKVLYWVLLPIEWIVTSLERVARLLVMIVIVTNPLFLAIYLLRRRERRQEEETPT